MISGKRYCGEGMSVDEAKARQSRELIKQIHWNNGASYLGDFLPILKWIDPRGIKKTSAELGKRVDTFIRGLVDEHRRRKGDRKLADSVISHLLRLQESEPENYSHLMIKGLVIAFGCAFFSQFRSFSFPPAFDLVQVNLLAWFSTHIT
ncbi:cytochrome P450 81E8-like isoform X1 [Eucalyptus grandis]|uniref:cytochrome P450 81E8-like isoform X1 n=1 Tax=Eucalyptus grandis TaxID=71139 RepID=UPI00192EC244|nr:cytochrome P450 81E8-like isoform X1 [Eucalyptus grandis]